ncbi:putative anti-sigma factor [Rhodovulum sulfidophilum]|uniref:Putative anti-sigma factor n=1 Tax=Rhodovulum sulfidophilum TaxID=35806 RepID=A0A0D6B5M2_RHOSU|nr:putative anti-sigma factor [Rhodovulum sulfidophilum]
MGNMPGRFILKYDFLEAPRVWDAISSELSANYPQDDLIRIRLGLTEIINNIVEHASNGQDDARFSLRILKLESGLFLCLSYAGPAFVPPPDALDAEKVLASERTRGRGLWLISQCFTQVRYRDRGLTQRVIARL